MQKHFCEDKKSRKSFSLYFFKIFFYFISWRLIKSQSRCLPGFGIWGHAKDFNCAMIPNILRETIFHFRWDFRTRFHKHFISFIDFSVPRLYGDELKFRFISPRNRKVQRRLVMLHDFFRTKVSPPASNMLSMVRDFFSRGLNRPWLKVNLVLSVGDSRRWSMI